jgi:hypothetical protein
MGGVSYCGVNPGRDQRFSMEAPPNFQLDSGQTQIPRAVVLCTLFLRHYTSGIRAWIMATASRWASTGAGVGSALGVGVGDWWAGDFVRTLGTGGVSYCGANPGWDQRCSMEAPPNF